MSREQEKPTPTNFASLACDIAEAVKAHEEAEKAESVARSAVCSARNRVNAAQKAFDAAVADLKKNAPRESNWHRSGLPPFVS